MKETDTLMKSYRRGRDIGPGSRCVDVENPRVTTRNSSDFSLRHKE